MQCLRNYGIYTAYHIHRHRHDSLKNHGFLHGIWEQYFTPKYWYLPNTLQRPYITDKNNLQGLVIPAYIDKEARDFSHELNSCKIFIFHNASVENFKFFTKLTKQNCKNPKM